MTERKCKDKRSCELVFVLLDVVIFCFLKTCMQSSTVTHSIISFCLKDPSDKRQIICDEKLKELFNVDTFHGFSVTKLLTAHLTKTEQ